VRENAPRLSTEAKTLGVSYQEQLKTAAVQWRAMALEEKARYLALAAEDKERQQRMIKLEQQEEAEEAGKGELEIDTEGTGSSTSSSGGASPRVKEAEEPLEAVEGPAAATVPTTTSVRVKSEEGVEGEPKTKRKSPQRIHFDSAVGREEKKRLKRMGRSLHSSLLSIHPLSTPLQFQSPPVAAREPVPTPPTTPARRLYSSASLWRASSASPSLAVMELLCQVRANWCSSASRAVTVRRCRWGRCRCTRRRSLPPSSPSSCGT